MKESDERSKGSDKKKWMDRMAVKGDDVIESMRS